MEICRLCLHQQTNLISLFNNSPVDFSAKIKACVSIEITKNDDFPQTVCESCIKKVNDWHTFKEMCHKSNQILIEQSQQNQTSSSEEENSSSSEDFNYLLVVEDDNFPEDIELTEDIQINLTPNVYKCDICKTEFENCFDYLDHQTVHNGQTVFQCDKCPEKFTNRENLVEHDRNHKRPCPKCGKSILKSSMKLHLIKHTDRHMCVHCSARFNSRASLNQHIITMHTNQKDHICETCGKRFSTKTAMNVHLKSHSDQRLYSCKICNYAGRTASAVYVHMSTHAQDQCVCEICSKMFKSTRNLNDHLRRVHSKEKKHECAYCDKKFVDKYMLTVHTRCHTGVRPYACNLCDKAFVRSDGLKEHMVTHGERVWYGCDGCGRKFASKKGVSRHQCSGVQ